MRITLVLNIDENGVVTLDHPLVAAAPIPSAPPVNTVCTGEATMFALNWNGSVDRGDNGLGAWGTHTANKTLLGCSLPEGVLIASCGLTGTWQANVGKVGAYLKAHSVQAAVTRNKQTVLCDIVDAGPSRSTHNCIDLTYAVAHQLQTNGKAVVSYQLLADGKPIEIKEIGRAHV
jgi:hypothetical protein